MTPPNPDSLGDRIQASREVHPCDGERLSSGWIGLLSICCLIAIGVSGYLSWVALTSSKVAGCGEGGLFDCGHVISSRWSLWMGIPVSLLSIGLYVVLASSVCVGSSNRFSTSTRNYAWTLVTLLGVTAGLAACWFVSLQIFILNHLCSYCMFVHSCGLLVAGVVLWKRQVPINVLKWAFATGLVGTGVLIAGQVFSEPPPTYEIERFALPAVPADSDESNAPNESGDLESGGVEADDTLFDAPVINNVEPSGETSSLNYSRARLPLFALSKPELLLSVLMYPSKQQETVPKTSDKPTPSKQTKAAPRRTVAINGGTIKLDVTQWPIVGSTKAKYIFVEMFDYSCPHCRNTHVAIGGAKKTLEGDVAVVMLPTPLNANCNALIQATDPKFVESCEISKLAIAVWRTDAAAFNKFHEWMFATEKAPNFASAKAHAETLVDPVKLATELNSDIPAQYVAKNVELYKRAGGGNVPKLMFPGTSIVGEFTSADALVDIIRQQLK